MRLRLLTALALVFALALPALAHASGSALIRDCTLDGVINKTYSAKDYADALANLPADVDEYSDCRDQIKRAQLAASGSGGSSSSGGGGTTGGGTTGGGTTGGSGDTGTAGGGAVDPLATASPQERAAFQKAVVAGNAPVKLDGRPLTPGTLGGAKSSSITDLPTPLLVMLALLAAGAVCAAALGTKRLVDGRRTA
ncbi:MAG TPA: hypothetical protein VK501_21380 [Baekduia sp.]|uniref:hypothetical protein n=1 Tax=Baekduia sp. TaxID=2600305 RepID=UPI002BD15E0F|nr:hypothetical protein [Baekduia sp.]HMJ36470.1 hypothetical protein [Baekduia sp.]